MIDLDYKEAEIKRLHAENERLRIIVADYHDLQHRVIAIDDENELLRLDLQHYEALQTAYHNANRVIERQEAENERLQERIAILEAELRVAYKLPDAIERAFEQSARVLCGNCPPENDHEHRTRCNDCPRSTKLATTVPSRRQSKSR